MESRVPSKDRERAFHLNVRILAFLAIVIGLLILRLLLTQVSQGQPASAIMIGALLGGAVAGLFGLLDWLTMRGPH